MKENVFEDENIIFYVNDNFIPILLDINNDTMPKGVKPIGTPTFFFITKKGETLRKRIYVGA